MIFVSNFLFLWSVSEFFGHKKVFSVPIVLQLLVGFVISKAFFAYMLLEILILKFVFQKMKPRTQDFLHLTDEIMLNLKTGQSFLQIFRVLKSKNPNLEKIFAKQEKGLASRNTNENQFIEIIQFCSMHPSLSYKVLEAYKRKLKISKRLLEKQKTISVQPKAQAAISGVLYAAIFVFQWHFQPDFSLMFDNSLGRGLLFLSFVLILTGIYLVFRISKPSEEQIL